MYGHPLFIFSVVLILMTFGELLNARAHRERNATRKVQRTRKSTLNPNTTSNSDSAMLTTAKQSLTTTSPQLVTKLNVTTTRKPKHPRRGNKERKANRTKRFILGNQILSSGATNDAVGQSISNGHSFTVANVLDNSQSVASGFSGYSPSTSTATSQSRRKRQLALPGTSFGGMMMGSAGQGTAIGTANAAMGISTSNGNTLTDLFGGSQSFANGMSSGYAPSSTSIATSGSQGRKKRQIGMGLGFPSISGLSSGTAIGTANAVLGTSLSNGNTFTDPFGNSRSSANGMSSGYFPSSTSIASSNSQGMGLFGRKKRQIFPGVGTGTAIGTATVALGQSVSNGNTFTSPFGNSLSTANGMSNGYTPSSSSIATSASQVFPSVFGRRKRESDFSLLEKKNMSISALGTDGMVADEHVDGFDFTFPSAVIHNDSNLIPVAGFDLAFAAAIPFEQLPFLGSPFMEGVHLSEATREAIDSGKGSISGVIAATFTKSDGSIAKVHKTFSHLVNYSCNNSTSCRNSTLTTTNAPITRLPILTNFTTLSG